MVGEAGGTEAGGADVGDAGGVPADRSEQLSLILRQRQLLAELVGEFVEVCGTSELRDCAREVLAAVERLDAEIAGDG